MTRPNGSGVREAVDPLAGAGHQHPAGVQLARDVGAELHRELVQQPGGRSAGGVGGEPQRGGGVGRAAAHAGRDRDALVDVDALRRGIPPGRLAEELERAGGEVRALDAGADDLVGVAGRGLEGQLVGQRHRLNDRHERVQPVRAGRPDEQRQVDLAGREGRELHRRASYSRRQSSGESVSARASGRPADRLECGPDAVAVATRQRERAGQRLAAVGEALLDERAQARLGRGGAAGEADEHRVDVRHRVEDRARDRPQRPSRRRPAGRAPTARRSAGVPARAASRSPTSFCTIATHVVAPGSCSIVRRITLAATPYGRFATTLVGAGSSAARSSLTASARWSVALGCGSSASRSGGSSRRSTSTTCTCAVRSARYSDSTPRPPPTSSTTSSGRRRGGARDHVEDVRVDQEVLAELAVRADAELPHAAQARLRREPGHQPSSRAAFASTAASSSS